jgi:hypothetical protein
LVSLPDASHQKYFWNSISQRREALITAPIFIVGPGRSGTTLLSRILDAHSSIAILPETAMFATLAQYGCSDVFENRWQYIAFMNDLWNQLRHEKDVASQVVAEEAQNRPSFTGPARTVLESLGRAYAKSRGATIWGEKTPWHLFWLPQIQKLFPNARIIITIRDPRDILLSYDDRWGGGRRDTEYLMQSCAQIHHYFHHFLLPDVFPLEQVRRVRYESLVSHPQQVMTEVCNFLNVPFESGMLEFYRSHQSIEQDTSEGKHHKLLSRPVTAERVGRHKGAFTAAQMQLIEESLCEELRASGYEPESSGDCILTKEERASQQRGGKRYERMRSGIIRQRLLVRGRLKLAIFRWLTTLAPWAFTRLATTSSHWASRVRGERNAGQAPPKGVSLRPSA